MQKDAVILESEIVLGLHISLNDLCNEPFA